VTTCENIDDIARWNNDNIPLLTGLRAASVIYLLAYNLRDAMPHEQTKLMVLAISEPCGHLYDVAQLVQHLAFAKPIYLPPALANMPELAIFQATSLTLPAP
jgi:hypothetical protein